MLTKELTKEEQLRLVFDHLLTALLLELELEKDENIIKKYTNIFMYEIKIRVKL